MDDIKDVKKTDILAKFIEGQSVRTNPFGDNRFGERAYRKAERLAAALYLLTNHVMSSEPAKEQIRLLSTHMLSQVLELRNEMRVSNSENLYKFFASIRNLISLIRILTVSGFVSNQNAEIIVDALDDLGNFMVASQRLSLAEGVQFSREDLLDVRDTPQHSIKDIKDTQGIKDIKKTPISSDILSVRGDRILDVLRAGGSLSIKDVVTHLPEYSEKMIQRELVELVSQKRVKKVGLKRWSRYEIEK